MSELRSTFGKGRESSKGVAGLYLVSSLNQVSAPHSLCKECFPRDLPILSSGRSHSQVLNQISKQRTRTAWSPDLARIDEGAILDLWWISEVESSVGCFGRVDCDCTYPPNRPAVQFGGTASFTNPRVLTTSILS